MKSFDFADIIYAATGISAQQFPDEYKGILAACEMAVAQEREACADRRGPALEGRGAQRTQEARGSDPGNGQAMTISREQLEKAAKAAGIVIIKHYDYGDEFSYLVPPVHRCIVWSPMRDRGQLLDLAMACKIDILPRNDYISYIAGKRVNNVGVDCQDFPALAEAVILAACEQFDASQGKQE